MTSIVIVDDRATNRTILAKLSRAFDSQAEVSTFAEPGEALAHLRQHGADLVITDYKMPQMNGAEFIRQARAEFPDVELPIVVITAYEDREFRYEALEAGAADFLLSPIDHREFRTRVSNILGAYSRTRRARVEATVLRHELDTEKQQHAASVAASERHLRQVLDTISNLVFTTRAGGVITLANKAFARACGLTPETMVGRRLSECVPDAQFVSRSLEIDDRVRAGLDGPRINELGFSPASGGNELWLQVVKGRILPVGETIPQVLTVATDITQRRETERALEAAIEAANRSNRAKTTFLANMSHELRTPMNAIIGFADMMEREVLGPLGTDRYREYAHHIRNSADHLLSMISDVLDTAQIESGDASLNEAELLVEGVVQEAHDVVALRADEAGTSVALRVEPGLHMLGDALKLRQVLINLLLNAIHAAPNGKVVLTADTTVEGRIRLVIEDDGVGMSPDEVEIALARFGRIPRPEARAPGTGLGLPLSVDLIRLHGGLLDLQSKPGAGTRIEVQFPIERTVGRPHAAAS